MENNQSSNFIQNIINEDLKQIRTYIVYIPDFEPNEDFIGHAKSIVLNFGIALQYGGLVIKI